jgi:hypothetical protein
MKRQGAGKTAQCSGGTAVRTIQNIMSGRSSE